MSLRLTREQSAGASSQITRPIFSSPTRQPADDAERHAALSPIRQSVNKALHELTELRLAELHRTDWTTAFDHSGTGSSYRRADEIQSIYQEAAPVISSAMSEPLVYFCMPYTSLCVKRLSRPEEASGWMDSRLILKR